MSKNAAMFVVLAIMLSACASKQPATPDWVAGDSKQYKSSQYLTGRGEASNQEEAKDRARADIAKVFQVAVIAESDDVQKYSSDQAGIQYESRVTRHITTHTNQIISGIQLAELWQDPASKIHHALAVLPRQQTAASLRQQVAQLDEDTDTHIERSRKSDDLFMKIAAANHAVESQLARESLQKMLQVVDISGRGIDTVRSSAKLQSDLDALLKRVHIASKVTADSTPGLDVVLSGGLAQAGFLIETEGKPDFILTGRLKLDDLGLKDGWYWQRGVLEIILSEAATNRVRGTKRWNIKGNAPDQGSMTKRALNHVDKVLKQELRAAIINMATSR